MQPVRRLKKTVGDFLSIFFRWFVFDSVGKNSFG